MIDSSLDKPKSRQTQSIFKTTDSATQLFIITYGKYRKFVIVVALWYAVQMRQESNSTGNPDQPWLIKEKWKRSTTLNHRKPRELINSSHSNLLHPMPKIVRAVVS